MYSEINQSINKNRGATMYTYVTENDFVEAFKTWQGGQYKDNFSYDGLKALNADFENYEYDTGEKIELDVVGICCEYSEYESLEEINNAYGKDWTLEELKDHTHVIEFEKLIDFATNTKIDAFIIQDF